MFQELETKRVLILGCGNVLMGDDGFGPAVVEQLDTTTPVYPGDVAEVDSAGNLIITIGGGRERKPQ